MTILHQAYPLICNSKIQNYAANYIESALYQPIQLRHFAGLDTVDDVNIWLHGLVVVVAGPFHHDIRRDAEGEGVDDEGTAAGMGADEFPFRMNFILALIAFVGRDSDFLVNAGKFA